MENCDRCIRLWIDCKCPTKTLTLTNECLELIYQATILLSNKVDQEYRALAVNCTDIQFRNGAKRKADHKKLQLLSIREKIMTAKNGVQ